MSNNPVNLIDPTGHWGIVGAVYGAVAGGIGGYISGGWQGAAVEVLAPASAGAAGSAAAAGTASLLGQLGGNAISGKGISDLCNYDFSAAAGAALGGGLGGILGHGAGKYFPIIRYPTIGRPLSSTGYNQVPGNTAGAIIEGTATGVGELGGQQF